MSVLCQERTLCGRVDPVPRGLTDLVSLKRTLTLKGFSAGPTNRATCGKGLRKKSPFKCGGRGYAYFLGVSGSGLPISFNIGSSEVGT